MFIAISYTGHLIISIFLHICGVSFGLFFWKLFPKNPVRYITKMPNEIILTVDKVDEQADYELLQQKVDMEERKPRVERYFG